MTTGTKRARAGTAAVSLLAILAILAVLAILAAPPYFARQAAQHAQVAAVELRWAGPPRAARSPGPVARRRAPPRRGPAWAPASPRARALAPPRPCDTQHREPRRRAAWPEQSRRNTAARNERQLLGAPSAALPSTQTSGSPTEAGSAPRPGQPARPDRPTEFPPDATPYTGTGTDPTSRLTSAGGAEPHRSRCRRPTDLRSDPGLQAGLGREQPSDARALERDLSPNDRRSARAATRHQPLSRHPERTACPQEIAPRDDAPRRMARRGQRKGSWSEIAVGTGFDDPLRRRALARGLAPQYPRGSCW